MASVDDVLNGVGAQPNLPDGAVQGPPQFAPLSGVDPADYVHYGSAFGSDFEGTHAVLTVRDVGRQLLAAVGDGLAAAAAAVLPAPFGPLAAAGLDATLSDIVFMTDRFILSDFVEPRAARTGFSMSLNQPIVYSSGMQPYIFRYSGSLLINDLDGDGRNEFNRFYRKYLRASAGLVGSARRAFPWVLELTYQDAVRVGYQTDMTISINALDPNRADITFTMFIINDYFI